MESEDNTVISQSYKKIFQIFRDFMTRITQFEELVNVGNRFLVSFQQGLDFLRRPPIDTNSVLVGQIMKANQSKRLLSYIEAGCVNTHDSKQNLIKCEPLRTMLFRMMLEQQISFFSSLLSKFLDGALNNVFSCKIFMESQIQSKSLIKELEALIDDATTGMQSYNEYLSHLEDKDVHCNLNSVADKELPLLDLRKPEVTDYAVLMAVIYGMVKQDYIMRERMISSLSLKSSSGELESYCLMWSLRPFIDDEIMHKAWRLVA